MRGPITWSKDLINHPVNRYPRAALRGVGHFAAAVGGGLIGLSEQAVGHNPKSLLSGAGYFGADSVRRGMGFAAQAFGAGLGFATTSALQGGGKLISGYKDLRSYSAGRLQRLRDIADAHETPNGPSPNRAKIQKQYGRVWDDKKKKYGARRFGARSPGEHLTKAGHNLVDLKWGPIGAFGLGLNIAAAGMMSSDNLFDPMDGMARHLAGNVAFEVGGLGGSGLGAAAMARAFPVAGFSGAALAGVGALAGFFLGGAAAAGALDMAFWGRSEFGHKHGSGAEARKSTFVDSEYASTMRQRALQSVYRSQLNARSAFGQEALAYHV